MINPLVEHVRKYAKEKNMTYMCAITEASKTYNKEQPKATPKATPEATPKAELKTLFFTTTYKKIKPIKDITSIKGDTKGKVNIVRYTDFEYLKAENKIIKDNARNFCKDLNDLARIIENSKFDKDLTETKNKVNKLIDKKKLYI